MTGRVGPSRRPTGSPPLAETSDPLDRQDRQKPWADVKDLFSRTAAELTEARFLRPNK